MSNFISNLFRSNKKLTIDQLDRQGRPLFHSFSCFSFLGVVFGAGNGCAGSRWTVISAEVFSNLSVMC